MEKKRVGVVDGTVPYSIISVREVIRVGVVDGTVPYSIISVREQVSKSLQGAYHSCFNPLCVFQPMHLSMSLEFRNN